MLQKVKYWISNLWITTNKKLKVNNILIINWIIIYVGNLFEQIKIFGVLRFAIENKQIADKFSSHLAIHRLNCRPRKKLHFSRQASLIVMILTNILNWNLLQRISRKSVSFYINTWTEILAYQSALVLNSIMFTECKIIAWTEFKMISWTGLLSRESFRCPMLSARTGKFWQLLRIGRWQILAQIYWQILTQILKKNIFVPNVFDLYCLFLKVDCHRGNWICHKYRRPA